MASLLAAVAEEQQAVLVIGFQVRQVYPQPWVLVSVREVGRFSIPVVLFPVLTLVLSVCAKQEAEPLILYQIP